MNIEKIAITAVVSELSKTDRLNCFLNDGDKEPCWDGAVYIHEDKKQTKKNIKRVSVQVKGKQVPKLNNKDQIKYRVSYDDLDAYMRNGGTMFFVVYIDESSQQTQIYYSELLPVKLNYLLKIQQKSYTILFSKFPEDQFERTEIFLNFYNDSVRQTSFGGKDLPTIKELVDQDALEGLSFNYTSYGKNLTQVDFLKRISGKPMTIYAKVKGSSALVPIEYIERVEAVVMKGGSRLSVSVGEHIYYDDYEMVSNSECTEYRIGSCVRIVPLHSDKENSNAKVTINIKIAGTLKERIKGIEFVSAMIEEGCFYLGDNKYEINFSEEDKGVIGVDKFPELLRCYKEIQDLLNAMNVTKDLNIEECTKEDYQNLAVLVDSVLHKKLLKGTVDEKDSFIVYSIANIRLAVVVININSECSRIVDYFSNRLSASIRDNEGNLIEVSQYARLDEEDFLTIDNLDLSFVIDEIKKHEPTELIINQANNTMLCLIKAYDKSKESKYIESARKILDWISLYPSYLDADCNSINKLQIILRERNLDYKEKAVLYKIIENTTDNIIVFGALLLLEETKEAKELFQELSDEEKVWVQDLPIYHFFKAF